MVLPLALRDPLRRLFPIDLRAEARGVAHAVAGRLALWQQQAVLFEGESVDPFHLAWVGRREQEPYLSDLFGGRPLEPHAPSLQAARCPWTALVSDWPLPDALRVPVRLRTVIPLGRPFTEVTGQWRMHGKNRRLAEACTVRRVVDEAEVLRVNRELLVPFARFRHGDRATLLTEADVLRLSREGALFVVEHQGEELAAHLGAPYQRRGQSIWAAMRFGHPVAVFEDPARFSPANEANLYQALKGAQEAGYALFDFGTALSTPASGLLQFKRRHGGQLSTFDCGESLWVLPPAADQDAFLFSWPLFSREPRGLVLHLGAPAGLGGEELLARLRLVHYGGLAALRLVVGQRLEASLVREIEALLRAPPTGAAGAPPAPLLEAVDAHGPARDRALQRCPGCERPCLVNSPRLPEEPEAAPATIRLSRLER